MKLNIKKLEQLKKRALLHEIVKVFSFDVGDRTTYQEFDLTPEIEDTIGVNAKKFVRCNPENIPNFIETMQGESSYIVPSEGVIKEGLIPENVSVIVKSNLIKFAVKEVIGSQVANWFKLNTCFNAAVKNVYDYDMISVDMIGENEKLFAFYELRAVNSWGTCEEQLEVVQDMLSEKNLSKHKIYLNESQKEKIINDYVYSHLVRRVLLSDDDFGTRNCGILYNKKTMQARLVNFDYEYIADPKGDTRYNTIKDIEYISKNYPELYRKFYNKAKQINSVKKPLYNTLYQYPEQTAKYLKVIFDKMYENIDKMIDYNKKQKSVLKRVTEFFTKEWGDYAK